MPVVFYSQFHFFQTNFALPTSEGWRHERQFDRIRETRTAKAHKKAPGGRRVCLFKENRSIILQNQSTMVHPKATESNHFSPTEEATSCGGMQGYMECLIQFAAKRSRPAQEVSSLPVIGFLVKPDNAKGHQVGGNHYSNHKTNTRTRRSTKILERPAMATSKNSTDLPPVYRRHIAAVLETEMPIQITQRRPFH